MKIRPYILFLALCLTACEKAIDDEALSVVEFFDYTLVPEVDCGSPVHHEGEDVTVTGYITMINYYPEESRFFFYDSPELARHVQVTVTDDQDDIFKELDQYLEQDTEGFFKFQLTGTIGGDDYYTSTCLKGSYLYLQSARDIRALD